MSTLIVLCKKFRYMQKDTWFYILSSELSENQETTLKYELEQFIKLWKSHGSPISGETKIIEKKIIIIQADTLIEKPSGCSIDSMKKSIEKILHTLSLSWLPPSMLLYRDKQGKIETLDFRQIKNLIQEDRINPDTIFFDFSLNQTDNIEYLEAPLSETWMKRFL